MKEGVKYTHHPKILFQLIRRLFSMCWVMCILDPFSLSIRPSIDEILQCVCGYYKVAEEDILSSRRGLHNRYRTMVMIICRLEFGYKNCEIAHVLKIFPANVSALVCRAKKYHLFDKSFRVMFYEIRAVKVIAF